MMPSMSGSVRQWRHIVFATRGSWLPGDPFSRRSSSPPTSKPPAAGSPLHARVFTLGPEARRIAGLLIVQHLERHLLHPRVIAVGPQHVHLLADLPARIELVQGIVSECKRLTAQSLRGAQANVIWAPGGRFVPLEDDAEVQRALEKVLGLAADGAWIWSTDQKHVA